MQVLFLSRWFPFPADNGSKMRVLTILQQLSERHDVALVSFGERQDMDNAGAARTLRELCSRVHVLPYREFRPSSPKALAGLLAPQPRFLLDTYRREMSDWIARELRRRAYDVIVASQLDMAPYALEVPRIPALLEELELATFNDGRRQPGRLAQRWRSSLTWLKLAAYLRRILPRFAACTVASEAELRNLREVAPAYSSVHILPNALDLARYKGHYGPPQQNTLVYAGALTYSANYDAVAHFLHDVYPTVLRAVPDALLRVTGRTDGVDLRALPSPPGVQYTGYVADVRPVVAHSWASVVPLRRGGGTRLKILEAMALGTPVVATPKGAEGLEVVDGENILLAADPRLFAARVIELLRSPALRDRLVHKGRQLVRSKYDARDVGERVRTLLEELGGARAA
jgi:glycosyltransferase involved in cell wall biosynthesis